MKRGSIFELNGIPKFQEALPLALQHVVAMIVGCVTPAIIVAGAVGGNSLCKRQSHPDTGISGCIRIVNPDSAFSDWKEEWFYFRFRTADDHGGKFCLCTKYAGNCRRLWNQFDSFYRNVFQKGRNFFDFI